jgi:hypothetical protein
MCETKEPDSDYPSQACDFNILTYNITNNLYNTDKSMKSIVQLNSEEKLSTYKKYLTTCQAILNELKLCDFNKSNDDNILETDLVTEIEAVNINRLNDTYRQRQSNKKNSDKTRNLLGASSDEINLSTLNEGIKVVLPESSFRPASMKSLVFSVNRLFLRKESNIIKNLIMEEHISILNGVNKINNK